MRRLFGLCCSIAIAAMLCTFQGASPAHAGVDNFSYESWESNYALSLDAEGRAVAEVTETLVAQFPDTDQNRGIVRGLPLRFEGAPSAPSDISIVNETGEPVPFEVEDDGTFRVILAGDDRFVHGRQVYVISYTLRDVIIQATETGVDEFYWDILPLERQQSIASFRTSIDLAPPLDTAFTHEAACYFGAANSTEQCALSTEATSDGTTVSVTEMALHPGQGVTVALGFTPGVATQPKERLPDFSLDVLPALLGGVATAISGVGVFFVSRMKRKRRTFRGSSVAQYDVPPTLPPLIAAPLSGTTGTAVAAEFIHLAVTGATRIEEPSSDTHSRSRKSRRKFFRLLSVDKVGDPLDLGMLEALFPGLPEGAVFEVPKSSTRFAASMQRQASSGVEAAKDRGYLTRESNRPARILSVVALGVAFGVGALLVMGATREAGPGLAISMLFLATAVTGAVIGLVPHRVYTPLGAEAREYLEGVREFIRVAEAERFRVLQSYSGADRLENGAVNMVQVYEKLLPYAILFGLEKEWAQTLQTQYEQQGIVSPIWFPAAMYSGNLGREFASFTSSLSSAASYTSSGSGGSSGGGFSGGGGGGGFSGGR